MQCLVLLAAVALGAAASMERGEGGTITVSAAISLSDALEDVAAAYATAGGGPIRFNFAGSNVLARQILNGAPADVFISADEAQMDLVERANGLVNGSRRAILENQLALAALPGRAEAIRAAFPRAGPMIRRLAIGDPAAVPAGVYARRYLERQGLWDEYAGRIIPTGNVRAALAAVEHGSADAAIVYVTDVHATRKARVALSIPRDEAPIISYPAAIVAGSRNQDEAERFLAFLQSEAARAIFVSHGFLLPTPR